MWEAVPNGEHEVLRRHIREKVEQVREGAGQLSFSQDVRYTLGLRPRDVGHPAG